MLQDILNWILLTRDVVQVGPSEAQSLAGVHAQLLLDSGMRDPVAWGELVVIVPGAQI